MQVQGVVQNIQARQTSVGTMYDLVIDGQSYGNGKYAPRDINVGDTVTFTAEIRGNYRNVGRGTLRKVNAQANTGTLPQPYAPQASAPQPAARQSAVVFDDRQAVISKQAALNTALTMVEILLSKDAVVLPKAVADRASAIEALLANYVNKFHTFSTGKGAKLSVDSVGEDDTPPFADDELPPLGG